MNVHITNIQYVLYVIRDLVNLFHEIQIFNKVIDLEYCLLFKQVKM